MAEDGIPGKNKLKTISQCSSFSFDNCPGGGGEVLHYRVTQGFAPVLGSFWPEIHAFYENLRL